MAAVGRLKPNAFGLFDVAGNVSEWCRDRLARYESPCVAGSGERVSLDPIDMRVYRGGAHGWSATALRSARRSVDPPGMRRPDLGVRPARRLDR